MEHAAMTIVDPQVSAEIFRLIAELADDWEYDGVITLDTLFLSDLGLESLDLVVLGTAIQHRYGKLPFSEFLAEIGQRPVDRRDLTVGELASYVSQQLAASPGGQSR
jgi:acyl carrier protein